VSYKFVMQSKRIACGPLRNVQSCRSAQPECAVQAGAAVWRVSWARMPWEREGGMPPSHRPLDTCVCHGIRLPGGSMRWRSGGGAHRLGGAGGSVSVVKYGRATHGHCTGYNLMPWPDCGISIFSIGPINPHRPIIGRQ